jgi:hypothetical protein
MFEHTSRYFSIETAIYTAPDGSEIRYVRRRFLPEAAGQVTIAEHVVTVEERLDQITARYLSDPEQFWRVCDSNHAMRPEALTEEPGKRLRITFPQP